MSCMHGTVVSSFCALSKTGAELSHIECAILPSDDDTMVMAMDLNSHDIDVHINRAGDVAYWPSIGLTVAAALLALVMGKSLDPKDCFMGVSDIE